MKRLLVSAVILSCVGFVGPRSWGAENAARPFHEINSELRSLLRREATASDGQERVAAIHRMAALYAELMQDERLATSDTLVSYRVKLRTRLLRIQRQLEAKAKRNRSTDRTVTDAEALAGQVDESMVASLAMSSDLIGGPSRVFMAGGFQGAFGSYGGAARGGDYGPALVDLIQRTIDPDFWDVNGGPGSIVYYPQWYALVVRATSEVHHKIGGVNDALRK